MNCEFLNLNILDLKRFTFERFANWIDKIDVPVDVRCAELDLGPFATDDTEKCKYNLYATVNHYGESANCGHYMAICKDESEKWWAYNDDQVKECPTSDPKNGYIFFYEKNN